MPAAKSKMIACPKCKCIFNFGKRRRALQRREYGAYPGNKCCNNCSTLILPTSFKVSSRKYLRRRAVRRNSHTTLIHSLDAAHFAGVSISNFHQGISGRAFHFQTIQKTSS
jgi:hypothetical protein